MKNYRFKNILMISTKSKKKYSKSVMNDWKEKLTYLFVAFIFIQMLTFFMCHGIATRNKLSINYPCLHRSSSSMTLFVTDETQCKDLKWNLKCHIHAYTVYTPIGGKGRCRTRRDLQDHSMQVRKSAGKISTLDLKPMRKDTRSPKQEQSVAPQNGPWSRQKFFKKKKKKKIWNDL